MLDAELQQRACEYLALSRRPENDELLATLCDEMPVFPERESALINRLHSKSDKGQDKRTWLIGQQTDNKDRQAERLKALRKGPADPPAPPQARTTVAMPAPAPPPMAMAVQERSVVSHADTAMGTTSDGRGEDIMSSLADLDLSGNTVQGEPLLPDAPASEPILPSSHTNGNGPPAATLGGVNPTLLAPLTVAPNVEKVSRAQLTYA